MYQCCCADHETNVLHIDCSWKNIYYVWQHIELSLSNQVILIFVLGLLAYKYNQGGSTVIPRQNTIPPNTLGYIYLLLGVICIITQTSVITEVQAWYISDSQMSSKGTQIIHVVSGTYSVTYPIL